MNEEGGFQLRGGFVAIVVVVFVQFGRGLGPVGGFSGSRPLLGVQFDGFCEYFSSPSNCVKNKHTKRSWGDRHPCIFIVFWRVQNPEVNGGGGIHSRGDFVVVVVVVLVVVVIVVEAGLVLWVDLGAPEPPFWGPNW